MTKRIAKKRYKKALSAMKHPIPGMSAVMIINQTYVDKNGKTCDPMQEDARFITIKRPRIQHVRAQQGKENYEK